MTESTGSTETTNLGVQGIQERVLPALIAIAVASTAIAACGGVGKTIDSKASVHPKPHYEGAGSESAYQVANKPERGISYRTHQIGPYRNDSDQDLVGDEDGDNRQDLDNDAPWDYKPEIDENDFYHDADDARIAESRHAASAADARTISALVERYYAAAAARDGSAGCKLLIPNLARAAPLDYGRFGAAYLRGAKTCAAVLTRMFNRSHKELSAPVHVTGVRTDGDRALTMLGSASMPAGYIGLERVNGSWGMSELLGSALA